MANEITASVTLASTKSALPWAQSAQATADQSGYGTSAAEQTIAHTACAALDFGQVSGAPRYVLVVNLDTTNYVELGLSDNSGTLEDKFAKLRAGDVMLWPPAGATVYAQGNSASVRVALLAVPA